MKKLLIITLIFISNLCVAQKINNDTIKIKRNGVSLNFFGITPVLGISYERIISNKSLIETGIGYSAIGAVVGVGYKFYLSKIEARKIKFNVGLSLMYTFEKSKYFLNNTVAYIPIGISYMNKKGFIFGLDLGPAFDYYTIDAYNIIENKPSTLTFFNIGPYGGLKFGYRF